jgi:Zn-dependent peptidase ImmA (M78 family)
MARTSRQIAPERAENIAKLAERVADEYCPTGTVEPEKIAVLKGISLTYDHYDDAFDGVIEYEGGAFYIHCNLDRENLPGSARGRFTVAHELGHYSIDEHRNALASGRVQPHLSFTDSYRSNVGIEREADFFASNLLMPPTRFKVALARARKRLSAIQDLAEKFRISITCAAIRYVDAEVEPSVIIHRARDGYTWTRASKQFQAMNCGRIVNTTQQASSDNPTAICRALSEKRSGVIGAKVVASNWFPALRHGRNFEVREEAMTLGRYGVLTLLTLADGAPRSILRE